MSCPKCKYTHERLCETGHCGACEDSEKQPEVIIPKKETWYDERDE